ncbi:MAG: hypothetical protein DMG12_01820 [Acidobacteria bacterium]|nr:MAG: hypothetical protein DMG12_01820 [Acidobacteriota bacterium]
MGIEHWSDPRPDSGQRILPSYFCASAKLIRSGRGHDFRTQDLWLAAQAVQQKFTVLTANAKDFQDIPNLKFVVLKMP